MSPINLTAEAYTIPFQGHELHARVFRPAAPAIGRIFYLHGGGLVFGEPDDLPLCYVNLFLNVGYELISLDYPAGAGAEAGSHPGGGSRGHYGNAGNPGTRCWFCRFKH